MTEEGVSHSHTLYAQLVSKAQGHEHEAELYELSQLAGVTIDPEIFKIVLDLLEMKCSPKTIADVLHSMLKHSSANTTASTSDLRLDLSQSDSVKNVSHVGQRTHSLPTHSTSAHSVSSSSSQNHSLGGRSGSVDQSRFSNVSVRSSMGDRRSQGSGSIPAASRSYQSRHDSSTYSSRGEHKNRRDH